jgi:hypothetical protein
MPVYLRELRNALKWVGDNVEDESAVSPTKILGDIMRRLSATYPESVDVTRLPNGGWRLDDRRGTAYSKAPPSFGEAGTSPG